MESIVQKNMDLLWENPSPTSNFSPQTVSFNAEGYDLFLVFYFSFAVANADLRAILSVCAVKGQTGALACGSRNTGSDLARKFIISDTGATFEGCYQSGQSGWLTTHCVPYRIYGLK